MDKKRRSQAGKRRGVERERRRDKEEFPPVENEQAARRVKIRRSWLCAYLYPY